MASREQTLQELDALLKRLTASEVSLILDEFVGESVPRILISRFKTRLSQFCQALESQTDHTSLARQKLEMLEVKLADADSLFAELKRIQGERSKTVNRKEYANWLKLIAPSEAVADKRRSRRKR